MTLEPRGDMIYSGDGEDLRQTVKLLRWLKTRKPSYFGKVTVSFERGEIVHLKQEHSISIRRGDVDRIGVEDL